MKKLALILLPLIIFSCSSTSLTLEETQELITKDVEVIFTTTEPNTDEIKVTYYDFSIGDDVAKVYRFEYDDKGSPLPIKIIFDNYKYQTIKGEGFRNSFSSSELKVQLYVEGVLVLENKSNGTGKAYAKVNFDYEIPN